MIRFSRRVYARSILMRRDLSSLAEMTNSPEAVMREARISRLRVSSSSLRPAMSSMLILNVTLVLTLLTF